MAELVFGEYLYKPMAYVTPTGTAIKLTVIKKGE